jgi:hypothetical protein
MMLSQAFTAKLFTDRERGFGNKIEANMAKLKYQPMTVITRVIAATNQLGLFTRDEYREMLGYAPLPNDEGKQRPRGFNNLDGETPPAITEETQ